MVQLIVSSGEGAKAVLESGDIIRCLAASENGAGVNRTLHDTSTHGNYTPAAGRKFISLTLAYQCWNAAASAGLIDSAAVDSAVGDNIIAGTNYLNMDAGSSGNIPMYHELAAGRYLNLAIGAGMPTFVIVGVETDT